MNCGVCRYPNNIRVEYFQTPLFVRKNEHAIKFEEWQKWNESLRPNVPEDYGMENGPYEEFNSPEEHLSSIEKRWPGYQELLKLSQSQFNDLERFLATAAHVEWAERQDRLAERQDRLAVNLAIKLYKEHSFKEFDPAI